MLSANIPLNKLNNETFKSFLVKYTGKIISAVTTLRKGYVDEIYHETLIKIRNAVIDKKLETLKSIVNSLDKDEAISIRNTQKYFADLSLAANLVFIKSNFGFIPDVMTSLEAKNR